MNNRDTGPVHDPIEASLTSADDRVVPSRWLPPQAGITPRVRLGQRWISVLWALPVIFALLFAGVAIAQSLRQLPVIQTLLRNILVRLRLS